MKHIEPELEPVGLLFSWHDPRKALATPSVLLLMTRLYIHTLKLPLHTTYTRYECEGVYVSRERYATNQLNKKPAVVTVAVR